MLLCVQVDTYENLYSFFLNRVRDNLHLALCFSPVGAKFSRRAMQFPGLINGCTIDWFLPWPEEALTSVSGKFISNFSMACPQVRVNSLLLSVNNRGLHVHIPPEGGTLRWCLKLVLGCSLC